MYGVLWRACARTRVGVGVVMGPLPPEVVVLVAGVLVEVEAGVVVVVAGGVVIEVDPGMVVEGD